MPGAVLDHRNFSTSSRGRTPNCPVMDVVRAETRVEKRGSGSVCVALGKMNAETVAAQQAALMEHVHFGPGGSSYQQQPPSLLDHRCFCSPLSYGPFSQQIPTPCIFGGPFYQFPQASAIMASPLSPEEMAEFQKRSNEYEPELEGPLVGPKQPTSIISSEYMNSDPVYVTKTAALPQTYSHYRIMKGDGNCGWRAVAFGYFETLLNLRDAAKISSEQTRIKSMNSLLDAVGQQEHLYEMFVDMTEDLFQQILAAITQGNTDDSLILDFFNSEFAAAAIITHFRLLTSSWMRLNTDCYQPFLPIPLDQYCSHSIDTVKTEIDEIGLQGLVDGVIKDSGIAMEILYLDRSQGEEVTSHFLIPPETPNSPTMHLLYRPGHYDLLYETISEPQPTIVNCVTSIPEISPIWLNPLSSVEMTDDMMTLQALLPLPFAQPMAHDVAHISKDVGVEENETSPSPLKGSSSDPNDLQIRLNPFTHQPMNTLPLSSIAFRNSQYNQAHFQNSEFQPFQWNPSEEYK